MWFSFGIGLGGLPGIGGGVFSSINSITRSISSMAIKFIEKGRK